MLYTGSRQGVGEIEEGVRWSAQDLRRWDAVSHWYGEYGAEPQRGAVLQGTGVPAGDAGDAHQETGGDLRDRSVYTRFTLSI